MLIQVIQIFGALLILAAFVLSQMRRLEPSSVAYLLLNFVGSFILAVLAARSRLWGFLLLEGVWALVSLWGTVKSVRGRS